MMQAVTTALKAANQKCALNAYKTYCFDNAYYAFINVKPLYTTTSGPLTCYEFNGTNEAQAEVTLSSKQLDELTKQPRSVSTQSFAQGYSPNVPLFSVKMFGTNGVCVSSTTAADVISLRRRRPSTSVEILQLVALQAKP